VAHKESSKRLLLPPTAGMIGLCKVREGICYCNHCNGTITEHHDSDIKSLLKEMHNS
jgi:hypothetical protein